MYEIFYRVLESFYSFITSHIDITAFNHIPGQQQFLKVWTLLWFCELEVVFSLGNSHSSYLLLLYKHKKSKTIFLLLSFWLLLKKIKKSKIKFHKCF